MLVGNARHIIHELISVHAYAISDEFGNDPVRSNVHVGSELLLLIQAVRSEAGAIWQVCNPPGDFVAYQYNKLWQHLYIKAY